MSAIPKQEPPYGLRMPPDLKARVKAAAEANNRSMNAEIVATLELQYPAGDFEFILNLLRMSRVITFEQYEQYLSEVASGREVEIKMPGDGETLILNPKA